jgi:hypothetical protein
MSVAAKDIVDGTFMEKHGGNIEMLPETEQVIQGMAMPEEIKVLGKKIDCEISDADFILGFKGWRESTSTSPSGHHLGHYKAIVTNPDLKLQKPKDLHLQEHETNFVKALVKLLNIPLWHRFAPKR